MTTTDILSCSSAQPDRDGSGWDLVEQLQGRWTLRILLWLNVGPHRFSDLRKAIPQVAANVLSHRLRSLQSAGLVERRYLPPPAASHVYALPSDAPGLRRVLDALASFQAQLNRSHSKHGDHQHG
jgi:DNA-binding HxlR family transcriptional regulator